MRRYKNLRHRILALVLAFVMTVTMGSGVSFKAYAVDGDPDEAALSASTAGSEDTETPEVTEGASEEGDDILPPAEGEGDPEDPAQEPGASDKPEDIIPGDETDIPSEEASEEASVDDASEEAGEEATVEEAVADKGLVGNEGSDYAFVSVMNTNGYSGNPEDPHLDLFTIYPAEGADDSIEYQAHDGEGDEADPGFYAKVNKEAATSMEFSFDLIASEAYKDAELSIDDVTVRFKLSNDTNATAKPNYDSEKGYYTVSFVCKDENTINFDEPIVVIVDGSLYEYALVSVMNHNGYSGNEEKPDLDLFTIYPAEGADDSIEYQAHDGEGDEADPGYYTRFEKSATSMAFSFDVMPSLDYEGFVLNVTNVAVRFKLTDEQTYNSVAPEYDSEKAYYSFSYECEEGKTIDFAEPIIVVVEGTASAKFRVFTNNERDQRNMLSITSFKYKVGDGEPVGLVNSKNYDSQLVTNGNTEISDTSDEYTVIPLGENVVINKADIKTYWNDDALSQGYTGFNHPYLFVFGEEGEIGGDQAEDTDTAYSFNLSFSDLDPDGYANLRVEGRPVTQFYFEADDNVEYALAEGVVNNDDPKAFHEIIDYDEEGTAIGSWYVAPRCEDNTGFVFTAELKDSSHQDIAYCTYDLQNFDDPEPRTFETGKCDNPEAGTYSVSPSRVHSIVDRWTNLVKISAVPFTYNNVKIVVPEGTMNVSARVGSQMLNLIPNTEEGKTTYSIAAEDNCQIVVTATAKYFYKITDIKLLDSKHTTVDSSSIPVSKTNEYTIAVGKGDACLIFTTESVKSIVVKEKDGSIIAPVSGKYSIDHKKKVEVYVADGAGTVAENPAVTVTTLKYTTENSKVIIDGSENIGKSGKVSLTLDGTVYSAQISFDTAITGITISGEKNNAISVPFGSTKEFKLTVTDSKADKSNLKALLTDYEGVQKEVDKPIDFGYFNSDKTKLIIDKDVVLDHYNCTDGNKDIYYGFFVDGSIVGSVHKLTLVNKIKDTVPTVKASVNDSTTRDIGLGFTLPKGVDSSLGGLYYKIVYTVSDADKEVWGDFNPDDNDEEGHSYYNTEYGDHNGKKKTNLNYWDRENHELVELYKEGDTVYIPATQKSASVRVTEAVNDAYEGWRVYYDVTVTLVQKDSGDVHKAVSLTTGTVSVNTRDQYYETKLGLIGKAPKKIFAGQNNVLVAVPKFSAATTLRSLEHVSMFDAQGSNCGSYYIDDPNKDEYLRWIYFDENNNIYLNTCHTEDDGNKDYLQAGKYTIVAYARCGSGKQASAKVTVTVVNPIAGLEITAASGYVLKNYNKAATLKTSVKYFALYEDEQRRKPDTKKVKYFIAKRYFLNEDGSFYGYNVFLENDPLYGKISVNQKNGTVTIDKSFMVTDNPEDNIFYVIVRAADYDGNFTFAYTEPIEISSVSLVPTTIRLMHVDWHYEGDEYHLDREEDSGIRDGDIGVDTGNASYLTPYVYDQNFNRMRSEDYTVKATGFTYTWDGMLLDNKPGQKTITVTNTDGSKKSVKMQFTTVYASYTGDNAYDNLDVTFQDGRREWDNQFNESFIVLNDDNAGYNTCPSPNLIYASVRAARKHEWDDYYDFALVNHTLKVTKGGKIKATSYGMLDTSTTYVIVPTAYKTEITVTDKTAGVAAADKVKKYVIYNTSYSNEANTAAVQLKADKKSIYSRMNIPEADFAPGKYTNPNVVTLTATKGLPENTNIAVITADNPENNSDKWDFLAALYGGHDGADNLFRGGKVCELNDDRKSITLPIYEIEDRGPEGEHEYWCFTSEMKAGTYSFYVTFANAEIEEGVVKSYVALAKPTKVSIKVAAAPKPKAAFETTTLKFTSKDNLTLKLKKPVITNGYDVSPYIRVEGTVINGKDSDFASLVDYERNGDGSAKVTEDGCYNITLNTDRNCRVFLGKAREEHWIPFEEMYQLKAGTRGIRKYDDSGDYTAAEEKAAYKEWLKNVKTGYISCEIIRYDGSNTDYQPVKFTLDIEKCIDSYKPAN
ncbi:MAG: hypothetical protein K6C96_11120 [Butyrivibrio sp.]|nr:hypothetical protein [Butyrivibrio sp.]